MNKVFLAALGLTALGVLGGSIVDDSPGRAPEKRGGYVVLESDFHAHTRFSDGFLSPFDIVIQARRRGLHVLAVTEHNNVFPGKMARWFSSVVSGPTILVGEEVTTNRFHMHGIGLTRAVDPMQSASQVMDDIHAQGGLVIAAHPVKKYWPTYLPIRDKLDGAEVLHPIVYQERRAGWAWEDMRDFYVDANAIKPLTAIGSSDYHFFSPLGLCRTLVFAKEDNEASVLEALRAGRTVVHGIEGEVWGDPAMIELLREDPYTPTTIDYGYRGNGAADRMARAVGWLGLIGLVLFIGRKTAVDT